LTLVVQDSAGLYQPKPDGDGLGMSLVDRRIKLRYGPDFGLQMSCQPDSWTRATLRLPIDEEHRSC
ncbi:MAG TPA: sensor histidine kinase, partial [Rhodoferax sp.]